MIKVTQEARREDLNFQDPKGLSNFRLQYPVHEARKKFNLQNI